MRYVSTFHCDDPSLILPAWDPVVSECRERIVAVLAFRKQLMEHDIDHATQDGNDGWIISIGGSCIRMQIKQAMEV